MFGWLDRWRRKQILEDEFPSQWVAILERDVAALEHLTTQQRQRLRDLVQVFVEEKTWEGCGGLELTDRIKVVIAAQACLLIVELDHDLYSRVESILVYPSTILAPSHQQTSITAAGHALVDDTHVAILGQAQVRGPVILSWDAVVKGGRHPHNGHNVVFHEFAHKLDMRDGAADGAPPLPWDDEQEWSDAFGAAYSRVLSHRDSGRKVDYGDHALSNPAEFFAKMTELFFEKPKWVHREEPDVYDVMSKFFRQDPAGVSAKDEESVLGH